MTKSNFKNQYNVDSATPLLLRHRKSHQTITLQVFFSILGPLQLKFLTTPVYCTQPKNN